VRTLKPLHGPARGVGAQHPTPLLITVAVQHPSSRSTPVTAKQHITRPCPSPKSALAVAALHTLKPLYPPHGVSAQRRRITLCSAPESETSMLAVAGARTLKPLHGLARTVGTQRRRSSNLLCVAVRHPLSRPAPATAKQHIPRPHPSPRSAHSPPPQRAAPCCTDQPRGVGAQRCPLIASSSCGLLLLSKPSTLVVSWLFAVKYHSTISSPNEFFFCVIKVHLSYF
jgi:hypothetical protein